MGMIGVQCRACKGYVAFYLGVLGVQHKAYIDVM